VGEARHAGNERKRGVYFTEVPVQVTKTLVCDAPREGPPGRSRTRQKWRGVGKLASLEESSLKS